MDLPKLIVLHFCTFSFKNSSTSFCRLLKLKMSVIIENNLTTFAKVKKFANFVTFPYLKEWVDQ